MDELTRWLVYWTTQRDASLALALIDAGHITVPDWLHWEIRSRYGRNGRGRLWMKDGLDLPPIRWPKRTLKDEDYNPIAMWIEDQSAGGIVVHRCQRDLVRRLPGLVTDWHLRLA